MQVLTNKDATVQSISKTNQFPQDFIPDLCIFHNVVTGFACPDGLAAAWVVRQKFVIEQGHDVKFIGCCYDDSPPNVTEYENILVVDFSFDLELFEFWENLGKG